MGCCCSSQKKQIDAPIIEPIQPVIEHNTPIIRKNSIISSEEPEVNDRQEEYLMNSLPEK